MKQTIFEAGTDDEGRRLDRVLRKFLCEDGLSFLYKSLRSGAIKVNGKKQTGGYRIVSGDKIEIPDFLVSASKKKEDAQDKKIPPLKKEWIVFRNECLLILNKPSGISVQKTKKNEISLNTIVEKDYKLRNKNSGLAFSTGPLHRLDKNTTGLTAFSQNILGATWFSGAVKNHSIKKTYLALVQGTLKNGQKWEVSISKNEAKTGGAFKTVTVNSGGEKSKNSVTAATPLEYGTYRGNAVTLVKFEIQTGRTHQIRSVSAFFGFPLLGDTAYGGKKIACAPYFLHAYSLEIPENPCGLPAKIVCPPPEEFLKVLEDSLINFRGEL